MNRIIRKALFPLFFGFLTVFSGLCYGGGEEDLFTIKVEPDALIVLDLSGSMGSPPPGDWGYSNAKSGDNCSGDKLYGTPTGGYNQLCVNNGYYYADSDACTGPFYTSSASRVNCQKKVIAKQAIYNLLDDDQSGNDKTYNLNKIDKQDELSLGVRLGYMKFDHCTNTFTTGSEDSGYGSGCNVLRQGFQALNQGSYGYFRTIYEKVESDINSNANRTPLAGALNEAKSYLDVHKAGDDAKNCRKKFVIFITDGWDTLACGANYSDVNVTKGFSYKRRRATVAAAKALNAAGYKVFVIGFGGEMPLTLANTLNWAAYLGGTDNPDQDNYENGVRITSNPSTTLNLSSPCNEEALCTNFNPSAIGYPGGSAALGNDVGGDCSYSPNPDCCTLAPNDPGFKNLSGYAFLATDATALRSSLRRAMDTVKAARYSFTVASVSAARITAGNYLYEASFIPYQGDDPFWRGHLKKYTIDDSGKVVKPALKDAGDVLLERTAARNMYTFLGGTIRTFDTTNITPSLLGLSTTDYTGRDKVVGYFRGESATYTAEQWRLGDIYHSNPVTVDPPSIYFNDVRSWNAFQDFRLANKTREWLIVLGANDGQLHAFSTGDLAEKWSFIPPNLLPKLKLVSHNPEPATQTAHQFFVDGPVTVADVWLGTGDGYSKTAGDWKTLMIVGLGKGVRRSDSSDDPDYLWSSSPSCDSGFLRKYNLPYQYYCGFWAFDLTNTSATAPTFKWRLNATSYRSDDPKYLDEPWSKMAVGRVKIGGNEKWVGFFGGGYNVNTDYDDDDIETRGKRGKGFFVVDLSNGNILWSYTYRDNLAMNYTVPASPKVLDLDNDGFVDTAYISDLGGNIWRFRFCSISDASTCTTNNWRGSQLFNSTGIVRASFTTPSVAMDAGAQLWVFWGTGNKLDPKSTDGVDRFFAVKEKDFTSTRTKDDLEKLTTLAYQGTKFGWYIEFPTSGEKMLFDSTVFGGMALFATYAPTFGTDPCAQGGVARLYAMAMMPIRIDDVTYNAGAGLMTKPSNTSSKDGGDKSKIIGTGIPTAPLISQKPQGTPGATDVFLTVSGGSGTDTVVNSISDIGSPPPPTNENDPCNSATPPVLCRLRSTPAQAQIIHWRDRRVQ